MTPLEKLFLYLRSVVALRSPNLAGFPLLPKQLASLAPYSRNAYNGFLLWLRLLGLENVKTVLDVGANHGDFSRATSTLFPSANIFLFEPLPDLQRYLEATTLRLDMPWRLMPFALGSEAGRFPLHVDEGDDAIGSFTGFTDDYLQTNPLARPTREILCEVRSLDEVARTEGWQAIDLLKIDVEGFEFEVFKGATAALPMTRAVIVEVSLVRRQAGTAHPLVDMLALLTRAGFHVVEIIPSLFDPANSWKPAEFNVLMRRAEPSSA